MKTHFNRLLLLGAILFGWMLQATADDLTELPSEVWFHCFLDEDGNIGAAERPGFPLKMTPGTASDGRPSLSCEFIYDNEPLWCYVSDKETLDESTHVWGRPGEFDKNDSQFYLGHPNNHSSLITLRDWSEVDTYTTDNVVFGFQIQPTGRKVKFDFNLSYNSTPQIEYRHYNAVPGDPYDSYWLVSAYCEGYDYNGIPQFTEDYNFPVTRLNWDEKLQGYTFYGSFPKLTEAKWVIRTLDTNYNRSYFCLDIKDVLNFWETEDIDDFEYEPCLYFSDLLGQETTLINAKDEELDEDYYEYMPYIYFYGLEDKVYKFILKWNEDKTKLLLTVVDGLEESFDPGIVPSKGVYVYASINNNPIKLIGTLSTEADAESGAFILKHQDFIGDYDQGIIKYIVYIDGKRYGHPGGTISSDLGSANAVLLKECDSKYNDFYTIELYGNTDICFHYQANGTSGDSFDNQEGKVLWIDNVNTYFFASDMNHWFSIDYMKPDYDSPWGGTGAQYYHGMQWKSVGDAELDGLILDSDQWKFEYLTEGDYSGWYRFTPWTDNHRITGQFKILSVDRYLADPDYGTFFGHRVAYVDSKSEFDDYYTHPITCSDIKNGTIFGKNGFANVAPMLSEATGQPYLANLHFDCNAIENAAVYFKPAAKYGETPLLKVVGTPVDYFIFYDGEADDATQPIMAKINSGKRNQEKMLLPGVTFKPEYENPFTLEEPNGKPHMNVGNGVEMVRINLQQAAREGDNEVFNELFKNSDRLKNAMAEGKLLKGDGHDPDKYYDIAGKSIYVAKIPNGFEYAPGLKYNVHISNADPNREDLYIDPSLRDGNIFLMSSESDLHVHALNKMKFSRNAANLEIAYRIYYVDDKYDTYIVNLDADGLDDSVEKARKVYSATSQMAKLSSSGADDLLDYGWKELNVTTQAGEDWAGNKISDYWMVECTQADCNATLDRHDSCSDDHRRGISKKYSNAYVQFRIGAKAGSMRSAPGQHRLLGSNEGTFAYEPPALAIYNEYYTHPLNGDDIFVTMNHNMDDIYTAIEQILDDPQGEEEEGSESFADGTTAAPVYYNLQGQRVTRPAAGLYIERRADKARKVIRR